jgi:hypothetical protein
MNHAAGADDVQEVLRIVGMREAVKAEMAKRMEQAEAAAKGPGN